MSKSDFCFGIIRIPNEFILHFFSGDIKLEYLPKELKIHSVHQSHNTMSLDVTVVSDQPVDGYTDHIEIGARIPEAYIKIIKTV